MTSYLTTYFWISLGIVFQGEIALLGAGHLIYAGSVNFWSVILIATLLSFLNSEVIFILSKTGLKLLPIPYEKIFKAGRLIERYKTSLLLFSRFIYGVRNIIPAAFGFTDIKHIEFLILNFAGALIWALTFTTVGFFSGKVVSNFVDLKRYQMLILGISLGIAFATMMFRILKVQKQK